MLINNSRHFKKIFPVASYILGPILSFAILPIITKTLNPSEYGIYNYYITLINYILLFSLFPSINSAVLRFLNVDFRDYKADRVALLKIIVFTSVLYFGISLILIILYRDWLFTYLVFAFYLVNLVNYYKSYLNVNGKKIHFSLLMISVVISQYLVVFIAHINYELKTFHLLLGNVLFSTVFILLLLIRNKNSFLLLYKKVNKQSYNKIIKFVIPSVGIALSGIILSSGDRMIIKNLLTNGDYYVGIYAINYTLYAQVIDIIVAIFHLYIPNYLYTKYEKYGLKMYIDGLEYVLQLYLLLTTLIITVVLFNYDKINYILFSSEYNVNSKISVYILIGQHYFGVYRIISNYYSVINKKKVLTYMLGITALINIVLNLVFISKFGYVAAAITTLFCYFLLFITSHIFITKSTKKDIIKSYNYILLLLPLIALIFVKEPGVYSSKFKAFGEILFNSFVILVIYCSINYRRIKLLLCKRKREETCNEN